MIGFFTNSEESLGGRPAGWAGALCRQRYCVLDTRKGHMALTRLRFRGAWGKGQRQHTDPGVWVPCLGSSKVSSQPSLLPVKEMLTRGYPVLFEQRMRAFGLPWWLGSKESACNAGATGDTGSIPGLGRSLEEGNGNSLQYSCLGYPMDRGVWRATVHRVAKSWTRLKGFSTQAGMGTLRRHLSATGSLTDGTLPSQDLQGMSLTTKPSDPRALPWPDRSHALCFSHPPNYSQSFLWGSLRAQCL